MFRPGTKVSFEFIYGVCTYAEQREDNNEVLGEGSLSSTGGDPGVQQFGWGTGLLSQPSCDTGLMDQASCPFLQWPHCSATLCRCFLIFSSSSMYIINHGAVAWLKVFPA